MFNKYGMYMPRACDTMRLMCHLYEARYHFLKQIVPLNTRNAIAMNNCAC